MKRTTMIVSKNGIDKNIDRFERQYAFLSNYYDSPIIYDGLIYPTVEHAFQAAKTMILEQRRLISEMKTPGEAKRAGRKVMLRYDWENVKDSVMEQCLYMKFITHPDLAEKLLATGDADLIEGNTWNDTYWGVCKGVGKNQLGKTLMKVRKTLRRLKEETR